MNDAIRLRRLPVRDLVNQADHKIRELLEHIQMDVTPTVAECHKLSRPIRRRSAYPSVRSLCNVYERLKKSHEYAQQLIRQIDGYVEIIDEKMKA